MDTIDIVILDILTQHARIKNKVLAKHLQLTEPAVLKRVKKLEDANIIARYDSLLNFDVFSCQKIVYLANVENIQLIEKQICVTTFAKIVHKYDYFILCFFKNQKQRTEFESLLVSFKECEWENVSATRNTISGNTLNIKLPNQLTYSGKRPTEIQATLLKAMHESGARKSLKLLSAETNLSIDQVWYNQKIILKEGFFLKFIAQPGKTLNLRYVYIFITGNVTKRNLEKINQVILVYEMPNGICLGCLVSSFAQFMQLLEKVYAQFKNETYEIDVVHFHEFLILNRYPYEYLFD